VSSEEEPRVLLDLHLLLTGDLDEASQETLIQGVKDAEVCLAQGQEWSGQFIAKLKRRHNLSWPALVKLTGVPKGTLRRRARPYL
jgi:DNA-binding transcriptional regulator YiaG